MLNLTTDTDATTPDPRTLADRFVRLMADAAADGIELTDTAQLHAGFLDAAMVGDVERCRTLADDLDARLGAARAARRIEEQRRQAANEIASLRAQYGMHLSAITRTQGDVQSRLAEFAAAEAAGDLTKCQELAAIAENAWRAKLRPASEIEAERKAGQEAAMRDFKRDQERRATEAHLQRLRERCAHGWNILADIEKHGTLRLGEDGAVLYSGQPLDEDLLWALDYRAEHVRNALRQRWQDRVVVPAIVPAEAV